MESDIMANDIAEEKRAFLVENVGDDYETESSDDSTDCGGVDEFDSMRPFDPRKVNITAVNISVHSLVSRIRSGRIDMAPDFQRDAGIWTPKAKVRLIESLLIRLPLPAFYFDATDDDRWVVIDGLQRLSAIKEYVIDQAWPLRKAYLEFLKDQCGDKRFSDLSIGMQGNIDESQVMVCKIMRGTPSRVRYDIFRRINTGGMPLNSQEIRHALNVGPITDFLGRLAKSDVFRQATGNMNPKRMNDRECVLRFLAFYENDPANYRSADFDRFLNEYMEGFNRKCRDIGEDAASKYMSDLESRFAAALVLARKLFGGNAFRKMYDKTEQSRFQVNKALFEAWMVNLARLDEFSCQILIESKDVLLDKFVAIMHDKEFEEAISRSTANAGSVRCRFLKIDDIIGEVVYA